MSWCSSVYKCVSASVTIKKSACVCVCRCVVWFLVAGTQVCCRYSQTSVNNIFLYWRETWMSVHTSKRSHTRCLSVSPQENQHLPSNRHALLRPLLSAQQLFSVKNILSMSGHIAPLCHSNYSHKALSCESINVRGGIQYHRMIGLYIKTAVGSLNIGIWIVYCQQHFLWIYMWL